MFFIQTISCSAVLMNRSKRSSDFFLHDKFLQKFTFPAFYNTTDNETSLHLSIQKGPFVFDRNFIIIRPPGTTVPDGLIFCRRCFFFSQRFLRDPSTDRPETLPHDRKQAGLNKLTSKIWGALPPKTLGAKNMQNFSQFWTTSDFDREYLRNQATYPKSERSTN